MNSVSLYRSTLTTEQQDLFLKNMGLAYSIAHKFGGVQSRSFAAIEKDDLIQCGLIGLLEAVKKFDPTRGIKFPTYAVQRIKGTIQDELRKIDWMPRSARSANKEANQLLRKSEQQNDGTANYTDIANELGISIELLQVKLSHALSNSEGMVSLEDISDTFSLDNFSDDDIENNSYERQELKEMLVDAIQSLESQHRLVILLYYYEELTFKEIGEILHLTESRTAQIHKSVLQHLKTLLQRTSSQAVDVKHES